MPRIQPGSIAPYTSGAEPLVPEMILGTPPRIQGLRVPWSQACVQVRPAGRTAWGQMHSVCSIFRIRMLSHVRLRSSCVPMDCRPPDTSVRSVSGKNTGMGCHFPPRDLLDPGFELASCISSIGRQVRCPLTPHCSSARRTLGCAESQEGHWIHLGSCHLFMQN